LKGLSNLNYLILSNNRIDFIENNTFDEMPYLDRIYIDYNNLKSIDIQSISLKLNRLILNNNFIQIQETNTFLKNTQKLKYLYLDNNALTRIEAKIFNNFQSMIRMSFKNNSINLIEPNAFFNCIQLKILFISFNKLEKIESKTFNGLFNLLELTMYQNSLNLIENESQT